MKIKSCCCFQVTDSDAILCRQWVILVEGCIVKVVIDEEMMSSKWHEHTTVITISLLGPWHWATITPHCDVEGAGGISVTVFVNKKFMQGLWYDSMAAESGSCHSIQSTDCEIHWHQGSNGYHDNGLGWVFWYLEELKKNDEWEDPAVTSNVQCAWVQWISTSLAMLFVLLAWLICRSSAWAGSHLMLSTCTKPCWIKSELLISMKNVGVSPIE